LERTRVTKLFLDKLGLPKPGSKILHFAPEKGLMQFLSSVKDVAYRGVDFAPENFNFARIEKFDLCSDAQGLPSNEYDLIIHSHVMEHVPCNITAVLYHLHRALKPGGKHFVCIPFFGESYAEDLGPIVASEATKRFGQNDHVRKFGTSDLQRTLGMIFNIEDDYSLGKYFSEAELDRYNIPEKQRDGFTLSSVFVFDKEDILLKD
jgi:phosphoglycolate phosphatase